jgi:2',3'-cyclic-nucleotide 2'-phosphodiesterase
MLTILFIGDIVGRLGRKTVQELLPKIKKEYKPDFIIANAENATHGFGVSESNLKELLECGIDLATTGDHAFDRANDMEKIFEKYPIIRPANYPPNVPGQGFSIINKGKNRVLVINLIGRVFMKMDYDCPFRALDDILANINLSKEKLSAIIIDVHAEATSEKVALGHYADGRVSAVFGTHTHVITADEKITGQGTAYISDAGMTGYDDGAIGIDMEGILKTFLTQINGTHVLPEKGMAILSGALVKVNPKNRKAVIIKRILKRIEIN